MQVGTEKPRFRQDLLAEAIDEQGAKFIDVMDPDSGTVFRFYEVEFSIACAMDGERDVAGIVQWAKDELGVTPSANEVRTVIATLGELGYLDIAGASKAAAADVPAAPVAAAAAAPAKVAEAPAKVAAAPTPTAPPPAAATAPTPTAPARTPAAAARTPAAAERTPARPQAAAAAAGGASDVSLDLSEHLAVGREDVQEAVRQSRVMSAVDVPPEVMEAATPPAPAAKVPERAARPQTPAQPERPAEAKQPERPAAAKQPERPVLVPAPQPEVKQPEVAVAASAPQPERPAEAKQPERPVSAPQPERPVEVKKPAVELPKVPEKQPAPMPEAPRRTSPVLIVLLILVVLGVGAFLIWQFVLNKQSEAANAPVPMSMAPVAPQPAPAPVQPQPEPAKIVTSKIEMSSGRPKTVLAFFPGTIEWIETSDKEAKSNDIIMKLVGHKAMEAQVAALAKEVEKLQADMNVAYKARDAVLNDATAVDKANLKVAAAEKAYNTKADQLVKKTDQLEPYYVRLIVDGKLTILRKAGEKIGENTPIATIVTPPLPSAVFKIPPELKLEVGQTAVLKQGEKLLTCEISDWEPETLRVSCPPESGAVEGAAVSYELP